MLNSQVTPEVSNQYRNAHPFPHIVIDNFLEESVVKSTIENIKNFQNWGWDHSAYAGEHQRRKYFTPWCENNLEVLKNESPIAYSTIDKLNSSEVLKYLEELTGIQGLIGDPGFHGGGFHKIGRNGKLDIHCDYNLHPVTQLHRRINLLIYLNENWEQEWGGDLELWERDMSKMVHRISPVFNRAVIFNITDDAYHGHPHPMKCPEGEWRYSIAMYYFTEDRPEEEKGPAHMALWQPI